ncbi:MAG: hypothetical protein ILA24_09685 [Ruminococcus sp.]|nr:hypothetical protein [Ruminococcus sp.]
MNTQDPIDSVLFVCYNKTVNKKKRKQRLLRLRKAKRASFKRLCRQPMHVQPGTLSDA